MDDLDWAESRKWRDIPSEKPSAPFAILNSASGCYCEDYRYVIVVCDHDEVEVQVWQDERKKKELQNDETKENASVFDLASQSKQSQF